MHLTSEQTLAWLREMKRVGDTHDWNPLNHFCRKCGMALSDLWLKEKMVECPGLPEIVDMTSEWSKNDG